VTATSVFLLCATHYARYVLRVITLGLIYLVVILLFIPAQFMPYVPTDEEGVVAFRYRSRVSGRLLLTSQQLDHSSIVRRIRWPITVYMYIYKIHIYLCVCNCSGGFCLSSVSYRRPNGEQPKM
jgi:hypothetical protein